MIPVYCDYLYKRKAICWRMKWKTGRHLLPKVCHSPAQGASKQTRRTHDGIGFCGSVSLVGFMCC